LNDTSCTYEKSFLPPSVGSENTILTSILSTGPRFGKYRLLKYPGSISIRVPFSTWIPGREIWNDEYTFPLGFLIQIVGDEGCVSSHVGEHAFMLVILVVVENSSN